jgi:hypothetical protein
MTSPQPAVSYDCRHRAPSAQFGFRPNPLVYNVATARGRFLPHAPSLQFFAADTAASIACL